MIEESIHNQRPTPTEDTDPPPASILLSRRTWQGWKSRGRERGFGFSATREQPPGRDGDRQPEAFGPCRSRHAGILPLPPAALAPFESLLDPGSQPVPPGLGGLGGHVGQDQPGLVMTGFPASQQGTMQTGLGVGKGGPSALPALADRRNQAAKRDPVIPAFRSKRTSAVDTQHRVPTETANGFEQPLRIQPSLREHDDRPGRRDPSAQGL